MLCVVLGIPGVGKTTVLNAAADNVELTRVNFGDVMFAEAEAKGLVDDRDKMRKLPREAQIKLQQSAAATIHEKSRDGNVIVDTHASIKTPAGYMPGLPEAVVRALDPDALVLVECAPKDIYNRRNRDESRQRDPDSVEDIAEHQMMNRCFAATYAELTNATVLIVKNEEGKVDEAGKRIAAIFT
jgi:adenylate kinase